MDPWSAELIEWDEGNESELAAHGISARDAEDVFWGDPTWAANKQGRAGDWKMVGRTRSGRAITVIVAWDERRLVVRPITGWDCTDGEKTRYLD